MLRSPCAVLVALVCSVQVPAFARASLAPQHEVDARAEALFAADKFLEGAQQYSRELSGLPERADTRDRRNLWAARAVYGYKKAFERDPAQCALIHAGLSQADTYLADLIATYGEQVTADDDHQAMAEQREALDQLRTRADCPAAAAAAAPTAVVEGPSDVREAPADPAPRKRSSTGLVVGLGVSAALTAGMAIGTGVLYGHLRKPGGIHYAAIQKAAAEVGVVTTDEKVDMCYITAGREDLAAACQKWNASYKVFLTTAVLTGVFAASTAVFTGLLLRQRRQPGPTAALLRRHQAQLGATPHLGGGASLTAGFQF